MKSTIGRFIYAIPVAIFGVFHFMNANAMAGMVPGWIPGGVFWVYLTGAALLAAAISIMLQKKSSLATLLLAIMIGIFALTIHLPGAADGDQASMTMFLKDMAIAGAALFMSGVFKD